MAETDQEIFASAMSDEPAVTETVETPPAAAEPAAATPAVEQQPATEGGPTRDPATGRFAPKTPAESPQQQPAAEPPQAAQGKPAEPQVPDGFVPSWRLREVSERAQAAERRAEQFERQMQQFMMQQRQNQPPAEAPDIFADPAQFVNHQVSPQLQNVAREMGGRFEGLSRIMAEDKFGAEAVNAAYEEMRNRMRDGSATPDYQRIMNSQHPYGELVRWHKNLQTREKVGDDLDGFLSKYRSDLLNDQSFMAEVANKLRGGQPNNATGKPVSPVQLPPSLNRATSSASALDDGDDMSDGGLLRSALRR